MFVCLVCFVVKKEVFTTNDTKHTKKIFFGWMQAALWFAFLCVCWVCWVVKKKHGGLD